MSQQTMSQLASLASRPDPAADTLAHYQALPVAHNQLEEATYESGALGVDDIVGWTASLDPGVTADLLPRKNVTHMEKCLCISIGHNFRFARNRHVKSRPKNSLRSARVLRSN